MAIFFISSKKLFITDRFLLTEEEMDFLDQLEKSYQPVKLKPYQLKKTFPVKKILAEKEKYYKKRLNRILEIERELTNKIFDTPDPLQKETWRCIRDGWFLELEYGHLSD